MTEKELQRYLLENYPQENERCDWKEMKSLKNSFDGHPGTDVLSYVSGLANMEGGELVIGVKDGTLDIVGTDTKNYKIGEARLRIKERCINVPIEDLSIDEFVTDDTHKTVWVIHIPKHKPMQPVYAHNRAYQRITDSLVELTEDRKNSILTEKIQMNDDWSAEIIADATIEDLDKDAIRIAREGYKQRYPNLESACDEWSDSVFLDKACLTINGKITRTAMLLVGRKESVYKLKHIAQIVWKCFQDGEIFGDVFSIPYIKTTSEILLKIRNYRFKIYPYNSLIPAEIWKYDTRSILEGLHNCIAHQDYTKNERIIVTERIDKLSFENVGNFYDGNYKDYVSGEKTPRTYRNPFLMNAMVNLKMIDSQGFGIHNIFMRQKERYLPMPDYDGTDSSHVIMNMPGTVIDENYSLLLLEQNDNITLLEAVLLDNVQKGKPLENDAIKLLRKKKLIEGRKPNIYISKKIAQSTNKEVDYSRHKGLDNNVCETLLLQSLKDHKSLSREQINELLFNVISDQLNDVQKKSKIGYILTKLRKEGKIINKTTGNKSLWSLLKIENKSD